MCVHVKIIFKYIETNADMIVRIYQETHHWEIFKNISVKILLGHMIK